MGEARGELSIEMRRFNSLEVSRPFLYKFLGIFITYELFIAGLLYFLFSFHAGLLATLMVIFLGSFGAFFIYQNSPLLRVPLAVNLNHPFMGDLELGTAIVMVQFSDGTWGDVGEGRVRLTVDELLGGSILIRDDDTYRVIGHFSSLHETHPTLKRYVMLINQAIALRDAVNGDEDLIESAREREQIESGLLERSWLEGQESIEIEPEGLLHKLRRE
ncbi:MAG: hypothetical protein ACKVHC_04675 [Candidatus Poseidoniales archaeon]|jgi:hypothetical protein|tara:strand:+ start:169 stop:819 length:651 start_codon:yes stop_codon:yes gene_type:complete